VGAHLFNEAIIGILKSKTRILVTNALHVLPHADSVIVVKDGRIVERGSFDELMATGDEFSRFAREHGMNREVPEESKEVEVVKAVQKDKDNGKAEIGKAGRPLQQKEDQAAGSISLKVWKAYAKAAHGYITIPLMFLALFLMGASQGELSLAVSPVDCGL